MNLRNHCISIEIFYLYQYRSCCFPQHTDRSHQPKTSRWHILWNTPPQMKIWRRWRDLSYISTQCMWRWWEFQPGGRAEKYTSSSGMKFACNRYWTFGQNGPFSIKFRQETIALLSITFTNFRLSFGLKTLAFTAGLKSMKSDIKLDF